MFKGLGVTDRFALLTLFALSFFSFIGDNFIFSSSQELDYISWILRPPVELLDLVDLE